MKHRLYMSVVPRVSRRPGLGRMRPQFGWDAWDGALGRGTAGTGTTGTGTTGTGALTPGTTGPNGPNGTATHWLNIVQSARIGQWDCPIRLCLTRLRPPCPMFPPCRAVPFGPVVPVVPGVRAPVPSVPTTAWRLRMPLGFMSHEFHESHASQR